MDIQQIVKKLEEEIKGDNKTNLSFCSNSNSK